MSKVVEVESLVKRYGALAAVDDVTFSVEEGEVFGVLGPNGAGKTTTVEMIEGLRTPNKGSIRVLGIDALREPERVKELIGVQLQTTSLYDQIRVREAVDLFGGYYQKAIPTATLGNCPSACAPCVQIDFQCLEKPVHPFAAPVRFSASDPEQASRENRQRFRISTSLFLKYLPLPLD